MDELFTTTSVATTMPSSVPSASLGSPATSTTSLSPTSTAPTSIDTTTLSPTTTRELLQTTPVRCSTAGLTSNERVLAAIGLAAPTPTLLTTAVVVLGAEDEVHDESSIKCSPICLSHNVDMLKSMDDNKGSSFEFSQIRYITNSTPDLSNGVVLFEMDDDAHGDQTRQNPKLLELLPTISVDTGPRLLQLNGNWVTRTVASGTIDEQLRKLWPPPMLLMHMSSTCLMGFSTGSCVFGRGKHIEGSKHTRTVAFNGAKGHSHVAGLFLQGNSVKLKVEMGNSNNWIVAGIQLTHTKMVCGSIRQPGMNFLSGDIKPIPWSSFWSTLLPNIAKTQDPYSVLCVHLKYNYAATMK